MNALTFEKLKKLQNQSTAGIRIYLVLTLLSLVTFFIYFFQHFTLDMLITDQKAVFPALKFEIIVLSLLFIAYSLFFKYINNMLKEYGLNSYNLSEYIDRNEAFFEKNT
ncbi:hypothetical protein B9T24_16360 [Acinetobacter sp. ANC 4654]|nr:hypothetical protein B9T24_16360 [Acinetobacter sp. ANC 4654]